MKDIVIVSLENFLSQLYVLAEFDFFRGHSSIDYKLIPSIGRFYKEGQEQALLQLEKEMFEDFKRKYSLFTDVRPRNDMEFLFLAQHYGLPTRLLDWTYNPLIALYFACISNPDKDGVVFHCMPFSHMVFDPTKHSILSFPHLTVLTPNLTDVRYKNQNGLFLLYPQPWKEEMEHIEQRFIIPAPVKKSVLIKLEKIGITRSLIMPSLDSLCTEILQIHTKRYPQLGF